MDPTQRRRQTISLKRRKKRDVETSVLVNSDFTSYNTDVLSPFESTAYISPTSVKYLETSYLTNGYESKDDSDYDSYASDYSEYYGGSRGTDYYWDWSWSTYYYNWSDSSLWAEWSWGESANFYESYNYLSWEEYYYDELLAPKDKWLQRIQHFKSVFRNESQ
ncbi:hypothetical protein CHS0354_005749 [Potamilus streckersoni]|uniref:Uncharacterized protein n=1 Tax=Potamilus streckersoni TaxID=2493646 RepID=A0AAE0VK14_9BIVA|nr:hypothetical protein CHS0354_005749 [Potamilus streckersoni]